MSFELVAASAAITLALVLYTFGVFGERRSGTLSRRHVLLFWGGLVCDTTGTLLMSGIAQQSAVDGFGVHAATGVLAIALMLIHATWATITFVRQNSRSLKRFHTFSTVVWLLWLVPYIIGMLVGIPMIHLKAICAIGTSVVVVGAIAAMLARSSCKRTRRSSQHAQ